MGPDEVKRSDTKMKSVKKERFEPDSNEKKALHHDESGGQGVDTTWA